MVFDNPLVSVIIPCYNVSAYVEAAVRSVINQTYINLEIIIVDDASTDNTLEVVKRINDIRIKIIELKENTKKITAVNTALRQVSGKYIAFQDADDWSEPTRIEEQLNQFRNLADLGICFTKYRISNHKNNIDLHVALTDAELKDEFLKYGEEVNPLHAPTMCATMMITRAVLDKTRGYHSYFAGRVAEDVHWVYRILKHYKGATVNRCLYNINLRGDSLTHLQLDGKNAKAAYSWKLLSKIIEKDIKCGIDLLDPINENELKETELIACEEALAESMALVNQIKIAYESSFSYRIGKFLLTPIRMFKKLSRF